MARVLQPIRLQGESTRLQGEPQARTKADLIRAQGELATKLLTLPSPLLPMLRLKGELTTHPRAMSTQESQQEMRRCQLSAHLAVHADGSVHTEMAHHA